MTKNILHDLNDELNDEPIHVCEHCGQVVDEDDLVEVHDGDTVELWCRECAEFEAYECARCGDWFTDTVTVVDEDGDEVEWCRDCADHHATICEHCGDYTASTESVLVGCTFRGRIYEEWCPSCVENRAVTCDDCGETVSVGFTDDHRTWDGHWVTLCDDCYEENWCRCDDCGDVVNNDEVVYVEYDDGYYCPNCEGYHNHSGNLREYHHTGAERFWLDDGSSKSYWHLNRNEVRLLFLGIELEVDRLDDAGDLADDIMSEFCDDQFECKHDGSLTSRGLEIVSQPMTPRWHLDSGWWDRITELVRNHDGKSHDAYTCGLHIHGSRDAFEDHDAVYRLDRMFHRFERELVRFSRRNDDQMRWCHIGNDDELPLIEDVEERKAKWRDKKSYAGRYEAVNDTNSTTVEIRLWRGTLNMETFRATIELTTGLILVANTMTDELAETLNWNGLKLLVRFALEGAGLPHDDLDRYLVRRGL